MTAYSGIGLARSWRIPACALLLVLPLSGCGPEPQAPSPTVNAHPHEFTRLKITVEPGSRVDNVEVESIWAIGNIGCAPLRALSGTSVQNEVHTIEKVKKVDADDYMITIMSDRFLPDSCKWNGNGYGINFMHGHTLLGVDGEEKGKLESKKTELTCVPDDDPPVCFLRSHEAFLRNRFRNVFNATVEIAK